MSKLLSVLKTSLTPDDLAKRIVLDGFKMKKSCPEMIVPSQLPIPVAKNCRRRIARELRVHMDHEFHSLFDKAVHAIMMER